MRTRKRTTRCAALAACATGVVLLVALNSAITAGAGAVARAARWQPRPVLVTVPTAAGAGAVTFTQVFKTVTESFPFANPCTGAAGTATITLSAVLHVTYLTSAPDAGDFHAIGSETGDGVLTPVDPTLPTYRGHFTSLFDDNNNPHNGADTTVLSIHATGTDGSSLDVHILQHVSVSATGVTVLFETLTR